MISIISISTSLQNRLGSLSHCSGQRTWWLAAASSTPPQGVKGQLMVPQSRYTFSWFDVRFYIDFEWSHDKVISTILKSLKNMLGSISHCLGQRMWWPVGASSTPPQGVKGSSWCLNPDILLIGLKFGTLILNFHTIKFDFGWFTSKSLPNMLCSLFHSLGQRTWWPSTASSLHHHEGWKGKAQGASIPIREKFSNFRTEWQNFTFWISKILGEQ